MKANVPRFLNEFGSLEIPAIVLIASEKPEGEFPPGGNIFLHRQNSRYNLLLYGACGCYFEFTDFRMRYLSKRVILKYLYDQLTGTFVGFVIGLSATSLVSNFFETRSLRNLWGFTSKKTVVDKETFANLEWIISIVIGFIVFELITKVVREKIDKYFPLIRVKVYRFIITHDLRTRAGTVKSAYHNKRVVLFSSFYGSVKNTFTKYSKR